MNADEINAIFKAEERKRLTSLTHYVLAKTLLDLVQPLIVAECYGCQVDHPSQLHHICLDPDPSCDFTINYLYEKGLDSIDKTEVVDLVKAAQRHSQIGVHPTSPEFDIHQCISEKIEELKQTEFRTLESDLKISQRIENSLKPAKTEVAFWRISENMESH